MNAQTKVATRPVAGQAVAAAVTVGAVLLALVALYAVFLDQGQLLSPVMGKTAGTMNYLHELVHDGRHLLGAPCH
ncbi:MAG TPA: CbtB-domain containing protein [Mycobacteriales bacterium]|nr:CbtB-domain containing protein [Mycobacteriales bacterium]